MSESEQDPPPSISIDIEQTETENSVKSKSDTIIQNELEVDWFPNPELGNPVPISTTIFRLGIAVLILSTLINLIGVANAGPWDAILWLMSLVGFWGDFYHYIGDFRHNRPQIKNMKNRNWVCEGGPTAHPSKQRVPFAHPSVQRRSR